MAAGGNKVNNCVVCDEKGEPMRVCNCKFNKKAVRDGKGELMAAGGNKATMVSSVTTKAS